MSGLSGCALTLPVFVYSVDFIEEKALPPTREMPRLIYDFLHQFFNSLPLSIEVIIVTLIYLQRIEEQVIVLRKSWRPLVFGAILMAVKFWEDISYWNVDFVDITNVPLRKINELENRIFAICRYKLYVSAWEYSEYYARLVVKYANTK